MMSQRHDNPRRSAASLDGGFTLTELLVVISIIGLLLGMLTPTLHQAIRLAWRGSCSANLKAIADGCSQYALADQRRRLPTVFTRDTDDPNLTNDPDNNPGWRTWANIEVTADKERGNACCLWLLVEDKRVSRDAFLCPEAESERGWEKPPLHATGFTVELDQSGKTALHSTISYSYISTTRKWDWRERLAEKMTLDGTPGTLVIVADQNPRCVLGQTPADMKSRSAVEGEVDAADSNREKMRARNSLNHRRDGQNMARLGGSVHWGDDPNGASEDDIYFSSVAADADERMGRRYDQADSFVIP